MQIYHTLTPASAPQDSAVALGYFDGVHSGHRAVLGAAVTYAAQHGLTAAAFTFELPGNNSLKGGRILSLAQKHTRVAQLGIAQYWEPSFEEFRALSPEDFVRRVLVDCFHAKAVFCGDNFTFGAYAAGNVALLEQLCAPYGITVDVVPMAQYGGQTVSSTRIRAALEEGRLDDANTIDPFHLEAYGETTVNYNRDVEIFPVVSAIFEQIAGESPYHSPTDMGVNMAGYAIVDDDACRDAARLEIVRRYFAAAVHLKRTGTGEEQVERLRSIMNRAGVTPDLSPARAVALEKEAATGAPAGAMVLPDGHVVTGKTGDLLGAASALLMHALKAVTGVDETIPVIDDAAIEPICRLKTEHLNSVNRRLHSDETLIALSITSATSPVAARVIDGLKQLRGCDAFFSVIISSTDEALYRKLGINVCCEPKYERVSLYHR